MRSTAGVVYDLLGYVHPIPAVPHDGMKFSSPDLDFDTIAAFNCAAIIGGSWWLNSCGMFLPTSVAPEWFSLPSASYLSMENVHIMVKLQ